MPIGDRLVHSLAIVSPTREDPNDVDEYGQPIAGEPSVLAVKGLVQPKSAREIALVSQAGAMVADHTIFLLPQTLSSAAFIRFDPDDGVRYEITGIRPFAFGRDPHLEVDARRIVSDVPVVDSGYTS